MSGDAYAVLDLLTAYQPAALVVAAARTGIFDALGEPATAARIAERTGLVEAPLTAALDALAALGYASVVGVDGDASAEPDAAPGPRRYGETPLGRLVRSDGELAAVVAKEGFFAQVWTELDVTLRTGRPRVRAWADRVATEPETARSFLVALVALARLTGPDLTLLPQITPGAVVVDAGGGLGSYAVPLAAHGAHVTLVDLPPVAAWARERLAGLPEAAGVVVRGADLLTEPACGVEPGSADVVLLAHLLHDLTDAQADRVIDGALAALRPGGVVVVVELPGDGPGAFGPLFDLMMQVETPGRARSVPELSALLTAAGMVDVQIAPYPRPVLVMTGRRA